ncbi:MAG: transketolase [Candidatus Sericytochromatia bacterium]|nr:transketolase [Candidatus Sericytochromatia bacterium]
MRTAFLDGLLAAARENPRVVLVVGDLGFSVVEPFRDAFPERFFNAGVAEQNMMGLAAGLASEGFHVFAYSIANFPTFRCAEQIRNDVAYHRLPVTVVAVGGGLAYGSLGYSHHAVQDYALLRAFPHMLLAAPGDPPEVAACLAHLLAHPQPSYLRLGKAGEPALRPVPPSLTPGRWVPLVEGEGRVAIVTTGTALGLAHGWLARPAWQGASLFTLPLWGMGQKSLQAEQVARFERVVTVEDHLLDGGFGSWLLEAVAAEGLAGRIMPRALAADSLGHVGSQAVLEALGGLG